jgi:hypothetical protein
MERPGVVEAVEADQPDVGVGLRAVVPFALAGAHPLAGVAPGLIVVRGGARRIEADPRARAQALQHVPAAGRVPCLPQDTSSRRSAIHLPRTAARSARIPTIAWTRRETY